MQRRYRREEVEALVYFLEETKMTNSKRWFLVIR